MTTQALKPVCDCRNCGPACRLDVQPADNSPAQMKTSEVIQWIPVSELPDAEITVLLFSKETSDPVWLGYHDGDEWRYVDGFFATPTFWAEMLAGPTA